MIIDVELWIQKADHKVLWGFSTIKGVGAPTPTLFKGQLYFVTAVLGILTQCPSLIQSVLSRRPSLTVQTQLLKTHPHGLGVKGQFPKREEPLSFG